MLGRDREAGVNFMLVPSSSGATPSGALDPCSRWGGLPEVTWTWGHGPWQTDQSRCGWLTGNGQGSWATSSPTLSSTAAWSSASPAGCSWP